MEKSYLDKIKQGLYKKIAIFASGKGSLTENIITSLEHSKVSVACIVTNNSESGVVDIAKRYNINLIIINNNFDIDQELKFLEIDLIVLAGFIKLIPKNILNNFKVINIHPSLLPQYGGKGMYGISVHKAVIDNREKFSGMTIHWVNEEYDSGKHIYQKQISIYKNWNEYDLEKAIKKLEYQWYPEVIKQVLYGHLN